MTTLYVLNCYLAVNRPKRPPDPLWHFSREGRPLIQGIEPPPPPPPPRQFLLWPHPHSALARTPRMIPIFPHFDVVMLQFRNLHSHSRGRRRCRRRGGSCGRRPSRHRGDRFHVCRDRSHQLCSLDDVRSCGRQRRSSRRWEHRGRPAVGRSCRARSSGHRWPGQRRSGGRVCCHCRRCISCKSLLIGITCDVINYMTSSSRGNHSELCLGYPRDTRTSKSLSYSCY